MAHRKIHIFVEHCNTRNGPYADHKWARVYINGKEHRPSPTCVYSNPQYAATQLLENRIIDANDQFFFRVPENIPHLELERGTGRFARDTVYRRYDLSDDERTRVEEILLNDYSNFRTDLFATEDDKVLSIVQ